MKKVNKETLRMQMLAGIITESQYKSMLNENDSNLLKQIFDKLVEDDRNTINEDPPEDPKVIDNFEQAVQNADPSTVQGFAKAFSETYEALEDEYETDFGDSIVYTIKICKQYNLPNIPEVVKACISEMGDVHGWSEEDKQEYFEDLEDYID
jgi:hypothetical protein